MRKVLITESSLRDLLRELMNSHAPIFPNPVVDPQAAETDPTNQNFVPSDKVELMSALRALVDPVDDERVPQVYVAVKDAIEKEETEMKDAKVEAIVRRAIRKILKESFLNEADPMSRAAIAARSSFKPSPSSKQVTQPATSGVKKIPLGVSGRVDQADPRAKFEKDVKDLREKFDVMNILTSKEKNVVKEMLEDDNIAMGIAKALDSIPAKIGNAFCSTFNQVSDIVKDPEMIDSEEVSAEELSIIQSPQAILSTKLFENIFEEKTGQDFRKYVEELGKEILNKMSAEGYFSGGNSNLEDIGKEVGLSPSGVKKESNIALGKYVLGMKCIKLEQYLKFQ